MKTSECGGRGARRTDNIERMHAPDPSQLNPTTRPELTNVVFLSAQTTSEFITVGDYTYFDD